MKGLTNGYLNELCSKFVQNFCGVFSCDDFEKIVKKIENNQSYLVNLSSSNHPGSHFVAIFKSKSVIYFDSFGISCFDKNILKVLARSCDNFLYSNVCIQSINSDFCGIFCSAFVMKMQKCSLNSFLSMFHHNELLRNDQIAVNIVKEFINQVK